MGYGKTKRNERVCVLAKREPYIPLLPGRQCDKTLHGHCTREKAEWMVEEGHAEWIKIEHVSLKGKVTQRYVAAVRLIIHRRWVPTPSKDERGTMKTLQLVS